MLWDLGQKMLQIFIDFQIVRLRCFHETVDDRARFGAMNSINDMPVGSANGEWPDSPLCCGIINGYISILQEYAQIFLLIQAVSYPIPGLFAQYRTISTIFLNFPAFSHYFLQHFLRLCLANTGHYGLPGHEPFKLFLAHLHNLLFRPWPLITTIRQPLI